jgi:hypothetical protein
MSKNWGGVKLKALGLGLGLVCLALQASAGGADSVLKVRIGHGLKELGANVEGLKPDVCNRGEKSWYQANGWSCEGYMKDGIRVGGVDLKARFRMAEPTFTVANVTLAGEVQGDGSGGSSRALVAACDTLMAELDKTYGRGDVTVMDKRPGNVKYVVFYGSKVLAEAATMVCQDNGSTGASEMVVDIVPSEVRPKPGVMVMRGFPAEQLAGAWPAPGEMVTAAMYGVR